MDAVATTETREHVLDRQQESFSSIDDDLNASVTSLYASGHRSIKCPKDAIEVLFEKPAHHLQSKFKRQFLEYEVTQEDMEVAAECGRFPQRPSDLFLKLFYGVVCTLEQNPLAGCVSPRLVGASGVIPLSIISTIPDIMRHYYHVIVHAQKEVLFATNYWQKGASATIISKALRDLSKRAVRDGRHVIVKLMIDHPTLANLANFHAILPPNKWPDYDIPAPNELPNVSLEVNNYHRLVMGTFHAKFLVIDRQIALLNSNNIQDRPNLEMMSHFEGDIVNSFYDTFLISWSIPFRPDLVCLKEITPIYRDFQFGFDNSLIASVKEPLQQAIVRARLRLQRHLEIEKTETYLDEPLPELSDAEDSTPPQQRKLSGHGFSTVALQALVQHRTSHSTQVLVKATSHLAGVPVCYDASPRSQAALTAHLNRSCTSARSATHDEKLLPEELEKLSLDFTPFVFHRSHQPFPIALVNRSPHGTPGHTDLANPQNAAWMGAFRYAQKSIFIQSPTLNASPAIDGIIAACRRGIKVTLWLDLGFNDSKEGAGTFQGGTNEQVVEKIYKKLRKGNDGSEKHLETFWYTGKDQARPLHSSQKKRNCHIKFMAIDDQVAIMGNGNMDTQSWFHSQEINAMIDSPLIVKDWMDALRNNQSTNEYGKVHVDGKWRDDKGQLNPNNGK